MYQVGQAVHKHYQITGLRERPPYGARYSAQIRGGQQVMLWALGAPLVDGRSDQDRLIERMSRLYKVRHPNLPQLLDLFVEGREVVMVQPLVTGVGVAGELLRRRDPLSLEEARVSLAHLCSAISQCHQLGLVVGDLWPEGVCFTPEGTMLIATGMGVQVSPRHLVAAMAGARLGSYVAPELRLWRRADSRADIWSLGALAHLMIYGHPYGWSDGVRRGMFASIGYWLRFGSRRVRPEQRHAAIDEVLRRALSSNPDRRPRDPESFYDQMARALHEAQLAAARAPAPIPDARVFAAGHEPQPQPVVAPTPIMTQPTQAMVVTPEIAATQPTMLPEIATEVTAPPVVEEPQPEAQPVARPTMSIDVDLAEFNKTRQLDSNEINKLLEDDKAKAEQAEKNTTKELDAAEIARLSSRTRDPS